MIRRVTTALAAGLLLYAWSDIMLWQRIFEGHDLFQFEYQYQSGHASTLVGFIAIGMILLLDLKWWALWYGAAFYTLAFSGLEDVLYYWMDGKQLPATLPWLDGGNPLILFHPSTSTSLLASTLVWLAFWLGTLGIIRVAQRAGSRV